MRSKRWRSRQRPQPRLPKLPEVSKNPVPLKLKLYNASGSLAFGVKDTGFSVFLLTFYNQVLGMEAWLVSLALVIALVVDAMVDPFLGALSDRTYTKWGRRLPWLYAAPIPLAFAWYFLWSPPVDGEPSFLLLLGLAIVVRLLLSACEVPSVSLVPEITQDYDERTTLFRYRFLFGWAGGLTMVGLAYQVFLRDDLLSREGYAAFGLCGAIAMAFFVLVSARLQHPYVAGYPKNRPGRFHIGEITGELREAFSEKAFLIFAGGALAAYVSQGMTFALNNYLYYFVWELSESELFFYPFVLFASVVLAVTTLGMFHRLYGKAKTGAVATLIAMGLWLVPYGLRYAGLWFEIGTPASAFGIFGFVVISNAAGVCAVISATSMVAEIIEAHQEKTGRRAEGSFYAGNWLVQKSATGVGILFAGAMLSLAAFPAGAEQGEVAAPVIAELVLLYCGAVLALGLISAYWLSRFPITREEHEARLAALDEAARANPDAGGVMP